MAKKHCDKFENANWHLEQIIKHFQECFGYQPSNGQLESAIKFTALFMQHVHMVNSCMVPGSFEWSLFMHQDPVDIALDLSRFGQPMDPPPTASLYFEP